MKNVAIYFCVRMLVAAIGHVPRSAVLPAGRFLGRLAHLLAVQPRRRACAQLAQAFFPRLSKARVDLLVRGMFERLGVHAVEACLLARDPGALPEVVMSESSRRALDEAMQMGRGVVFATAHLGNFELMAASLAASGYPIHTIARKSYEPRITRLLDEKRRACGVSCIYRNEPGAAAAMLRVLRRGEVLGLLMDQDTRVPSVFVPFFGKSASTPKGAAALARATGAAAVIGTIHRTARGNHVIDIARQELPADEWQATALLTAALEARIRRHPADWLWLHERWKTQGSTEVLT